MIAPSSSADQPLPQPGLNPLSAAPADSDLDRRKKLALAVVLFSMAALVIVAVTGALITGAGRLSFGRLIALLVAAAVYVAWSLHGTRQAVQFALRHHQATAGPAWPPEPHIRSALYLCLQFAIAELIVWLAGPAGILGLLWLVFLPPIGQSIMRLRWPGIAAVSLLSIAMHTLNVAWWHGTPALTQALPGFSIAVLFTLGLTHIAVSAERARGEVERLAGELSDANTKLREYALQVEELAATRERNRVAREIHDGLGHCLTVVHVQLEAARTTFELNPARAIEALGKAQALTHAGLQEIRRSVAALRVSPLHNRPLAEAIGQLAAESRAAGLETEIQVLGQARAVSPQVELTLYRAVQEGLTNCRKHSQSNHARLQLDYQNPAAVRMTLSDDGVGASNTTDGFGLLGLRERALLLGGRLSIQTAPGQGFTLELEVPA